jgi:hypothetical protein
MSGLFGGRSASAAPPQGRPLRLVSTGSDGRFVVGQEALDVLSAVKGPVAVAAVCGRSRQGKSYVLNQIARTAGAAAGASGGGAGFAVASTHKPCTKGLWLWSSPIPRTAPDGSTCADPKPAVRHSSRSEPLRAATTSS